VIVSTTICETRWWPQDVAGQAFEAAQVAGRNEDIGVEVEAGNLSVTGAA